jgi:hypothetical protein
MNTEQKIIKNKVGLLKLSEMLGSVSAPDRMLFTIGRYFATSCALEYAPVLPETSRARPLRLRGLPE